MISCALVPASARLLVLRLPPECVGLRRTGLGIADVLLQVFGHADPEVEHGRAGAQIDASGKRCQVSHLRIVARRDRHTKLTHPEKGKAWKATPDKETLY